MILVDTSVWIDLLKGRTRWRILENDLLGFVTCGPVMQEVLQGVRSHPASEAFRRSFLAIPVLSDPLPRDLFLSAAEIFRFGRSKGYTIRSSIDCLIAAVAIENRVELWHKDRDYGTIARFTNLRVASVGAHRPQ